VKPMDEAQPGFKKLLEPVLGDRVDMSLFSVTLS